MDVSTCYRLSEANDTVVELPREICIDTVGRCGPSTA